MIVTTLLAATVAAVQPAAPAKPAAAPAPVADKKMACCEKMKQGEGCDCCKDMDGKPQDPAGAHDDHGGHDH